MAKSASFGVVHVVTAFTVSYAVTGSLAVSGALVMVEPVVNTVVHFFFDRWWAGRSGSPAALAPAAAS